MYFTFTYVGWQGAGSRVRTGILKDGSEPAISSTREDPMFENSRKFFEGVWDRYSCSRAIA